MELIDRVAFMKDLAERTEANKDLCKDDAQYLQVVMVMNGFFQDLKEFPTVKDESRTYEDGYKKGYEDALFSIIKAIIDLAEDDGLRKHEKDSI